MVDVFTPEQRSRIMSRVKGKNTALELRLRKALWSAGLRYRVNYKLLGKPDVVFAGKRVAVFIDGCFWHGCPIHGQLPATNTEFWRTKIEKNKKRDAKVTEELTKQGWTVIRFWGHEVKKDLESCVSRIKSALTTDDLAKSLAKQQKSMEELEYGNRQDCRTNQR